MSDLKWLNLASFILGSIGFICCTLSVVFGRNWWAIPGALIGLYCIIRAVTNF